MRILVTGSAGFLGTYLFKSLKNKYEVFGVSRREATTTTHPCDITSPQIKSVLNKVNPEIIVHSAALTYVDRCEVERNEAYKINVAGTKNLVDWLYEHGGKFVFISTDAVYPGEKNGYNESSETRPVNYYGETKLKAEELVSKLSNFAILRTTGIFGIHDPGRKNFLTQLLDAKEKRKIPYDQISNPTDANVLVEYIERIIENDVKGLYVATGPETMSRMDFTKMVIKEFELKDELFVPSSSSDLGQKARRPLNNGTNSSLIRKVLNYECPSVRESLKMIKKEMKSEKKKN